MITVSITIPIPAEAGLATSGRVLTFCSEFIDELRGEDIDATFEMTVHNVPWHGPVPTPAPAAPAPNGHAPAPKPKPQPAPARADIAAFPKSAKANRYNLAEDELRGRVLAELVSLADDGVAPSQARWDEQRDPRLPGAAGVTHRLKMKWGEICALAGLETKDAAYRRSVRKLGVRAAAENAAPAPDEEEDAGGEDARF